jgi:mRNA interferase YafQ
MREIEWSKAFERDYKRELKTYGDTLNELIADVILLLMGDEPLPAKQKDHNLIGQWRGCRECHVRPDLLLIYEKYDTEEESVLFIFRLGSHPKLYGK